MSQKTEMRIQGHVVEVENPKGSLIVQRIAKGSYFCETSKEMEEYWFHIPIPTPSILDGVRPTLNKIFINYTVQTTNAVVYISNPRQKLRENT